MFFSLFLIYIPGFGFRIPSLSRLRTTTPLALLLSLSLSHPKSKSFFFFFFFLKYVHRNWNSNSRMATSKKVSPPWLRGRLIGRGSFGSVSLGFHRVTGRVFAVKSVQLNSHPDSIDSLENEIRVLSSLDYSPHVVEYLGNDFDGSHRNLHLELLPGGTVTDAASWLRNGEFSTEGTLRSHTRCLLSALRHVHSRGIVHCDVKGRNVVVGEDPSVAKLVDFGSAIRMGSRCKPRGSPLWMAPEVVRGEYQGPESDVWALGCTVIEMVTGRPAWDDEGAETMRRIGFSDETPGFPAELSEQGWDFLEKCLRREPKERWSCHQLLQHPFVTSETPADSPIDSSPRCVLDWLNSEFEEELGSQLYDENTVTSKMEYFSRAEQESCARDRVWDLCHGDGDGGGATWESDDDWVVVRNPARLNTTCEASCGEYADCEREAPGRTGSEYGGTSGAERENGRILSEYLNGGSTVGERGEEKRRSCRHGIGEEALQGDYRHLAAVAGRRIGEEEVAVAVVVGCIIYTYSLFRDSLLSYLPHFLLAMFSGYDSCCNFKSNKEEMKHLLVLKCFFFLIRTCHEFSFVGWMLCFKL